MPDPGIYRPSTDRDISAAAELARSQTALVGTDGAFTGVRRARISTAIALTLTAADSGSVIISTAADLVHALPATAPGLFYTFALAAAGLSTGTGLSVSPVAADKIMGNGFTSQDDKDAILTGATDREGDSLTLAADGVDGWYIVAVTGTWARQA